MGRLTRVVDPRPRLDAAETGPGGEAILETSEISDPVLQMGSTVGRAILYSTTFEFLQHLGLRSLDELPPLGESPKDGGG